MDSHGNLAFAEDGLCNPSWCKGLDCGSMQVPMVCHKDRAQEVKALAQKVAISIRTYLALNIVMPNYLGS